jgi:pyridoxamine 5'-phosphate oxidase
MQNPLERFSETYERAKAAKADWPEACCLATADAEGVPSARMVLFRRVYPTGEDAGITVFTNYDSAKAADLEVNPRASVCVYWHPIQTQVRLSGAVRRATAEESDEYFATRPRGSQLGAWASRQSRPLASMQALQDEVQAFEKKFEGQPVPRPDNWGGYRIICDRIEFWSEGEYRLHKRELFRRVGLDQWEASLLSP